MVLNPTSRLLVLVCSSFLSLHSLPCAGAFSSWYAWQVKSPGWACLAVSTLVAT